MFMKSQPIISHDLVVDSLTARAQLFVASSRLFGKFADVEQELGRKTREGSRHVDEGVRVMPGSLRRCDQCLGLELLRWVGSGGGRKRVVRLRRSYVRV